MYIHSTHSTHTWHAPILIHRKHFYWTVTMVGTPNGFSFRERAFYSHNDEFVQFMMIANKTERKFGFDTVLPKCDSIEFDSVVEISLQTHFKYHSTNELKMFKKKKMNKRNSEGCHSRSRSRSSSNNIQNGVNKQANDRIRSHSICDSPQ